MNTYEELLCNVIINAGEKIIDASSLYNTKYSYRDSLFLTIIAEEELAKIILVPFAKYADNLDELLKRPSAYYKHPIKQKIFTSYGLQNRDSDDIELLKQQCLYVGPLNGGGNGVRKILKQDALEELKHATRLFNQLAVQNILMSQSMSSEFKTTVQKYVTHIYVPAISDLLPEVAEHLAIELENSSSKVSILEAVEKCPLVFAEMMSYALPSDYEKFFREVQGLSQDAMMKRLETYL